MLVCWLVRERLVAFMTKPIIEVLKAKGQADKLVYLNPTEPFNLYLKVCALAGLFVTSPYVLYQVWLFISPGLYRKEKKYVVPFMASTILLFVSGGYFGYRLVYPRAFGKESANCEMSGDDLRRCQQRSSMLNLQRPTPEPGASCSLCACRSTQVRKARTGSIRVARQAGKKHAISATMIIIRKASPNANGSRGLTL